MKKKILLLITMILALSITACGGESSSSGDEGTNQSTEDSSNQSDTKGGEEYTFRVGVAAQHKPWCYMDENNEVVGIDPTILEEVCNRNGWNIEYEISSFDGMFGNLDAGKVDTVAQQISATPQRAEKYDFSEIYAYNPYKLYVHEDSDINGMEDMKGHSFVCGATSIEYEYIMDYKEENDPNDEIEVIIAEESNVEAVSTGKVDGSCYPVVVFDSMVEESDRPLKMVGEVTYNEHNVYPFKKGENQDIYNQFNDTLKEMKEEGFLTDLYMEHFGLDLSQDGAVDTN